MNIPTDNLNRLHDLAHLHARVLRRQAQEDFWRGALRLMGRLTRRMRGRGTRCATLPSGV